MKHHAKASPAGSTSRGAGLGSSRRALVTRDASLHGPGTGAPSRPRLTLVALAITAFLFLVAVPAHAAKVPYFSFGSTGTAGGQFGDLGLTGFGASPGPAGSAVNPNGAGSGATAGDVYVVDRENNRVQQFHANGGFVRAFGQDVVFSGQDNSGANEQQTVNVPNTVTGGGFKLTITAATGLGTLTEGSKEVTGVRTFTGAFAVGESISGSPKIPAGTTIVAVSGSSLTLSAAATGSTPAVLNGTETTASIEWNAAASGAGSVQQRLEALPSIGAGGVAVSGGPGASGTPFTVTFTGGIFAHNDVSPLTVTESTLLGGSAAVATVANGGGFEICEAASSPADVCQLGLASSAGGGMSLPQGIAVDPATGNLFLTDRNNRRVDVFSAAGSFLRAFGQDVVQTGKPEDNPAKSAVQTLTVTATGGKYTLTFQGKSTGELNFNATAAEVQAALRALSSIGSPNVNVAEPTPGTYTITFASALANSPQPLIAATSGPGEPLTGGTASVANTTTGSSGFEVCTTAANCQTGASASTAGAFANTFSGYIAVAPPTAPNPGDVLVADPANRRVQEFTPSGAFVRAFGFDVVSAGPDNKNFSNGSPDQANEVQSVTVKATAGQFTLKFGANTTTNLNFNASAAEVQSALNALASVNTGGGSVSVSGGPGNAAGTTPYLVTFSGGPRGGTDVAQMIAANVGLSGGSPSSVTVATVANGNTGFEVCKAAGFDVCKVGATSASGTGQFGTNGPARLAEDSAGAIYTVESISPNFRVQKFTLPGNVLTPQGTFVAGTLSGTSSADSPTDVAIGPSDHLFVVKAFPAGTGSPAERRVLELDPSGTLLDTHLAGSKINSVNGLSVDSSTGHLTSARLYVSSGTLAGGQQVYVFIDPPAHPPTVVTGASSAGANFALEALEGTVNPAEFKVSDCRFEYGTSTEYETSSPCVPAATALGEGTADLPVSAETGPLEPNTTYHYRLLASNLGATATGEDRTFATGPAPPDTCPNASIRAEQGIAALLLPACMALEMVSPPQKAGFFAVEPNVSADGSRVSFISPAALGEDPPAMLAIGGSLYVASRAGSGWTSEMTVPRLNPPMVSLWDFPRKQPSFTPDFSRWFVIAATSEQLEQGIGQAYEDGLGPFLRSLSPPLVPLSVSGGPGGPEAAISHFLFDGASADHSHLYTSPGESATYFPGDPDTNANVDGDRNVFLARIAPGGQPLLELLQRDRTGKVWGGSCGARLGGEGPIQSGHKAPNGERNQGAVSADGYRTYLSSWASQPQSGSCDPEENKLRILERLETPAGSQITPLFSSECSRVSPPCSAANGDDLYQGASLDQTKVYFTTNRQLANSDTDGTSAECSLSSAVPGCDLYLYDRTRPAGERLVQVSAGEDVPTKHQAGSEADVFNGITAISADGSHVYFVATGVLTEDENPVGDSAQPGQPNLYLWDAATEATVFIGTLAAPAGPGDSGDGVPFVAKENQGNGLWGGQGTWRNDAYPVPILSPSEQGGDRGTEGGDGHILLFESKAELSPDDADGRHLDVYRYDAVAETLACLSCAPGSSAAEPDQTPLDVDGRGHATPLGTDFAESGRWASEDGREVGFMTPESLLPGDVNGAIDGYLWRQGDLVRLPGNPFRGGRLAGPVLSHDGSTVAFATVTPLLPQDGDLSADVYVARAGGGFPNPPPPQRCQGEECRGQPSEVPQQSGAGTAVFAGPPNPEPKPPCKKGKVRRHGRCVQKHHRRHKRHDRRSHEQAGRNHGGWK